MDAHILANAYVILGAFLLACFGAHLAYRNGHKARLAAAAAVFRAAINPAAFAGFQGHYLHAALVQAFPAHLAASKEFRRYLSSIDRLRFNKAWNAYHGGDERYPDWLARYCVPAGGPALLIYHLETLRNIAGQT